MQRASPGVVGTYRSRPRPGYRAGVDEKPGAVADDRRRRDVPTGVIMVGMAAIAWWPAFTLGAWGEIFFDDILALWAASAAALVFVLVEHRPLRGRLARALLLLLPSVWLLLSFVAHDTVTDVGIAVLDLAAFAAVVLGIPFTLWVLVRIVWPDFAAGTPLRSKWLIAVVVLGVVIASFVLGLNQARFLTCEDFSISGNSPPAGCSPANNG